MEQNTGIPDGLLEKLLKLKNLKEGADSVGSHAEAANAAGKMAALLLKHNLSEGDIDEYGVKKKVTMMDAEYDLNDGQSKTEAGWLYNLFKTIAYVSMCKVVFSQRSSKGNYADPRYDQGKITVLGEKTNVAMVFYIVEQLVSKIDHAYKLGWKQYHGEEKRNTFRRGFLKGAVDAIHDKLVAEMEEQKAATENKGMELMIINKMEQAKEFMLQKFPNLRTGTSKQGRNLSGYGGKQAGYDAGSRMSINKGVGGSSSKGRLE